MDGEDTTRLGVMQFFTSTCLRWNNLRRNLNMVCIEATRVHLIWPHLFWLVEIYIYLGFPLRATTFTVHFGNFFVQVRITSIMYT